MSWVIGGGATGSRPGAYESFGDRGAAEKFKVEVERAGHQWPAGWVKGTGLVTTSSEQTLGEVFGLWLDGQRGHTPFRDKKAYSLQRERRIYELHIAPALGHVAFNTISRETVEDWVDQMHASGAAPKSIQNWHGVLSAVLKFGSIEMGLRPDIPSTGVPLPRSSGGRQTRFYTHGEWRLLRTVMRDDIRLMCDVALETGVRWGELAALRVGDRSLQPVADDGITVIEIHVQRAWSHRAADDPTPILHEQGETKVYKLGAPKSGSDRWVLLAGQTADQLWQQVADCRDDPYVFTTVHGKPWRYETFHSRRWKPTVDLAKQYGLRKHATFNMLRHTYAIWALLGGVMLREVSYRLGHVSIQTTIDRYGGVVGIGSPRHRTWLTERTQPRTRAIGTNTAMPVAPAKAPRVDHRPTRALRAIP